MLTKKNQLDSNPQAKKKSFKQTMNDLLQKVTTSDLKDLIKLQNPIKMIKSEPSLAKLEEIHEEKRQKNIKNWRFPRFARSPGEKSSKKRQTVKWNFLSPPAKDNPLVHKPPQPKKLQEEKPYRTEVIPSSNLTHDKMKNFAQNPEKFLLNVDEELENVFKKSVESIIRTAKVIPVKDWEIRDSTDLLEGFTGKE